MKLKAGKRFKAVRELTGMGQQDFADYLGIKYLRVRDVEQCKVRMTEDEFSVLAEKFPALLLWVAAEGDIEIEDFADSTDKVVKFVALQLQSGMVPEGYFLEDAIKNVD